MAWGADNLICLLFLASILILVSGLGITPGYFSDDYTYYGDYTEQVIRLPSTTCPPGATKMDRVARITRGPRLTRGSRMAKNVCGEYIE